MISFDEVINNPELSFNVNEVDLFELIVKYSGDLSNIKSELGAQIEQLNSNFAIITGKENELRQLINYPQIEYIERPKLLGLLQNDDTCMNLIGEDEKLNGAGVFIGIIDSGINANEIDTANVLVVYDQENNVEYTKEKLVSLQLDNIGHGTAVTKIAMSISPKATFIIVKLNTKKITTTQLMRAVKYITDKAGNNPLVINISFGTNDGGHDGRTLFESYINEMAGVGRSCIVVASGNEGAAGHHYQNKIANGEQIDIEIVVSEGTRSLYATLWKSFVDEFDFEMIAPNGERFFIGHRTTSFVIDKTKIFMLYGEPTPHNSDQEVYFEVVPQDTILIQGIWTIKVIAKSIVDGEFNIWLPISEAVTSKTFFLNASTDITLTLPSTAENVITVGGYDIKAGKVSSFSGRGFTRNKLIKPDVVAPAEAVLSNVNTGTSFSAPYVTGICALLMQWGIVDGNDIFLYGQKLKAYLWAGAKRRSDLIYPNNQWGYGSVCLNDTLKLLKQNAISKLNLQTQNENAISKLDLGIAQAPDDFVDVIVKYNDYVQKLIDSVDYVNVCVILNNNFALLEVKQDNLTDFRNVFGQVISEIPFLLAPMDKKSMDASGITQVQNQPYLDLRGQGVLVAIIDTGIDYTRQDFIYEDGTSKIISIWDQSIDGNPPKPFCYGTEFTQQQINSALQSDTLLATQDEIGHGTLLAELAAGRAENNIGAAPDSDLVIVKLKPASEFLRDVLLINNGAVAYQSNDVMAAVDYVYNKSIELNRPIAICIGLGTNQGSHYGESLFEEYLAMIARQKGVVLSIAAGNEGNARRFTVGYLSDENSKKDIELNIAEGERGVVIEIWNYPGNRISASVTSPLGEKVERIPPKNNSFYETKLVLEKTTVLIGYEFPKPETGKQLTVIRLAEPTPGIWTITLFGDIILDGKYEAWLPVNNFVNQETIFLSSSVENTITVPGTASVIITVGAYNTENSSLYIGNSRGPKQGNKISPNLVAPGVNVNGATGTSIATAIVTGASALLLQWGIENRPTMNTQVALTYLIQGCTRKPNIDYPNNQWGYGELNLIRTFELLRLSV